MTFTAHAAAKPVVNEKELTACVLVAEAGGEGIKGMRAVCEVIKMRMKLRHMSMKSVVTERNAFSCYNKYRRNPALFIKKWKKHHLFATALQIVNNYDSHALTNFSDHFHEQSVHPEWSKGIKPRAKIGKHLFFSLIGD